METTVEKLTKVLETKEAIRTAINNKGGTLTESDTFSSYSVAIDNIQTGGGENFLQEIINNTKSASFIFPRYREAYTNTYWTPDDRTENQYTQEFVDNLIKNIDLSSCTTFKYFMYNCKGFSKLPNIYSGNATNFYGAFYGTELKEITFIDTSSATNMESMFGQCKKLTTIKQLDTSNATNIFSMFSGCESLTSIPQLDISKATSTSQLFSYCKKLTSIPQLDTSNAEYTYNMFRGCESLTSIPLLDTSKSKHMESMFSGCKKLTSIPQLNTSNVTEMNYIFSGCESLTSIPQLDTSKVTTCCGMFYGCKELMIIPQLNTSSATNIRDMFNGCSKLRNIPELDVSKATDMVNIVNGCTSLTSIGMYGFTRSIDISSTALEHDALVAFLNQAGTAYDSSQRITMGSAKLALLSDEDKAIATNKGWTLA